MNSLISQRAEALSGGLAVPGDKSVSHRALMLGALAVGETVIEGLLEAEDVLGTAAAVSALGAAVSRGDDGVWRVSGRGVGGLGEPERALDMGNSGTGARLLMGILATHPFTTFMTGDASLCRRPMRRVTEPLAAFGARFVTRSGGRFPVAVIGAVDPLPVTYRSPIASAQVKSAVLLAGLNAPGVTTVIEGRPTRDHTELMLGHFGARVRIGDAGDGARAVSLEGQPELAAAHVRVPGDMSSAAFPLVAAVLIEGSALTLRGVGVNPLRAGLITTLQEMGAAVDLADVRTEAGEPVADLVVRGGRLKGVDVPAERVPSMIDEYPILAVAAACAEGATRLLGVGELRVKESDRLGAMARGLAACGVEVEETADSLVIHGTGRPPRGGARVTVDLDHRIAMAFLVLGMVSREPVGVDDAGPIATSFPGFVGLMNGLGGRIAKEGGRP
ncbi:MAG: 3-phosphoshikimate 1-carboxyvinyltransferase [Rhodospirillales bacterium]|nr:3-phosphoshikimate 1-carboxyvinyltransferase [Rhodospirillales bacterium]